MRQFYQSTYYFWIISKLILAIFGIISAIGNLKLDDLNTNEKLANYIGLLYALCLVLDLIYSFNGNYNKLLKYINGTISIILGAIVLVVVIKVKVISLPLTIIFILWVVLLGIFDLLQIRKSTN